MDRYPRSSGNGVRPELRGSESPPFHGAVPVLDFCRLGRASLGSIFMVYTHTSIVRVFFITAASFGAVSLWGYTTQRDLSGIGSFLLMGLFGVILASLVNMFMASSALQFVISVVGVLVFAGLTAWDTQRLKSEYLVATRPLHTPKFLDAVSMN
jgi:FtsH-binding integral membrane protein